MNGQENPPSQEKDDTAPRLRRRGGQRRGTAGANLGDSLESARQSIEGFASELRDRVEERPLQSLAIAIGAGYVLGGGLFTRFTGRLVFGTLRLGTRLLALPVVRDEFYALVEALGPDGGESTRRQ